MKRVACVLVLAAACGDDPNTGASDASASTTGNATTTTAPPTPTTGNNTADDGTGTGTASSNSTPPTTSTASDASTGQDTTSPTSPSSTTGSVDPDTTAPETTNPGTDTTADTLDDTTAGSTTGGCSSSDDCPPPPGACAIATCSVGVCGAGLAPLGTPCPGGVCDADGSCVACNLDADCPGNQVCVDSECAPPPPSCDDNLQNGGETDTDCGGPCPACPDGQQCEVDGDCLSNVCQNGTCVAAPNCMDNQQNGGETDVDCGGPCPGCQNGEGCLADADCLSGECTNGTCTMPATCMDSLKNGVETDIDCGGGTCPACQNGDTCEVNTDCVSTLCNGTVCVAQPNCMDSVKNGNETDIDCGGGTCPDCQNGDSCLVNGDCVSNTCTNNVCVQPPPQCTQQVPDPATGQRCPLFMACAQSSECGVFQGCQQWFCNNAKCELNALVGCWQEFGGQCNADVVFSQQTLPPVAKRFVPPDGVDFRELASLVFTVKNNSANDLYLDKLPLVLDVMGGGSKFDVSSVKIFDNSGGSEHGGGDLLVCLTADPFSFPANGVMGPCAGSAFSRVPKGQTNQFLVNVAFAANKTFIAGRSYRLRMTSTAGIQFKVGFNGPLFAGTTCGIPNEGYTGAWVTAQNP